MGSLSPATSPQKIQAPVTIKTETRFDLGSGRIVTEGDLHNLKNLAWRLFGDKGRYNPGAPFGDVPKGERWIQTQAGALLIVSIAARAILDAPLTAHSWDSGSSRCAVPNGRILGAGLPGAGACVSGGGDDSADCRSGARRVPHPETPPAGIQSATRCPHPSSAGASVAPGESCTQEFGTASSLTCEQVYSEAEYKELFSSRVGDAPGSIQVWPFVAMGCDLRLTPLRCLSRTIRSSCMRSGTLCFATAASGALLRWSPQGSTQPPDPLAQAIEPLWDAGPPPVQPPRASSELGSMIAPGVASHPLCRRGQSRAARLRLRTRCFRSRRGFRAMCQLIPSGPLPRPESGSAPSPLHRTPYPANEGSRVAPPGSSSPQQRSSPSRDRR